jgi:transposase
MNYYGFWFLAIARVLKNSLLNVAAVNHYQNNPIKIKIILISIVVIIIILFLFVGRDVDTNLTVYMYLGQ